MVAPQAVAGRCEPQGRPGAGAPGPRRAMRTGPAGRGAATEGAPPWPGSKTRPLPARDRRRRGPRHRWDRPLQAPGHTQVDFEERVDFRRLHAYRLGARARRSRARASARSSCSTSTTSATSRARSSASGRATSSTRWCLLTGNGEPWVWDFGSAARHHRLYAPQIPPEPVPGRHGRHARRRLAEGGALPEGGARRSATSCAREGVAEHAARHRSWSSRRSSSRSRTRASRCATASR